MAAAPQTVPSRKQIYRCTKKGNSCNQKDASFRLVVGCLHVQPQRDRNAVKNIPGQKQAVKNVPKAVKRTRVPTKINMAKTTITKQRCDYTQDLHHLVFRHEKFDKKRYPCLRSCKLEVDCTCRPHNPPQLRAIAAQLPFIRRNERVL